MDDLSQFEALLAPASSAPSAAKTEGGDSLVQAGSGSANSAFDVGGTPSFKRRKTEEVKGEIGTSPEDGAKVGRRGQIAMRSGTKACDGCHRNFQDGKSFLDGESPVPLITGGRGNWCQDCFTVFRTCFGQDNVLTNFKSWLSDTKNQTEFDLSMLAFLSLQMNGSTRITQSMIVERAAVIKFVLNAIGIPVGPRVVVPLDVLKNLPDFKPDPRCLITLRAGDGTDSIGYQMSESMLAGRGKALGKPDVSGVPPQVVTQSGLSCSNDAEVEMMRAIFGQAGAGPSYGVVDCKAEGADTSPSKSRLGKKLDALIVHPANVLGKFAGDQWEDQVKESSLTSLLSKIHACHDEASTTGEKDVSETCELWIVGLSSAKAFLRAHRDWKKSKSKNPKFMQMLEPLLKFVDFMKSTLSKEPSPTLALLWLKLRAFDKADKHPAEKVSDRMFACMAGMVEDGVSSIMQAACQSSGSAKSEYASKSSGVSPDAWLRAVLFKVLVDSVGLPTKEGEDQKRAKDIFDDIASTKVSLENEMSNMQPLEPIIDDLTYIGNIFSAVSEPEFAGASDLTTALKEMGAIRMKMVYEAMQESTVGKSVIAAARLLVQEGAKDSVASDQLASAMALVTDKRLPRVSRGRAGSETNDGQVLNFHMLSDMTVVDIYEEALTSVESSILLWSRPTLEKQAKSLSDFLEQVVYNLSMYDESLVTFMQGLIMQSNFGAVITSGTPAPDGMSDRLDKELNSFGDLQKQLDDHNIDDTPLQNLYDRVTAILQSLPSHLADKIRIDDMKVSLEALTHNQAVRACLSSTLESIRQYRDVAHIRMAGDIIEDWRAKTLRNAGHSTFITLALDMLAKFRELRAGTFQLDGSDEISLKIVLEERHGGTSITGNFGDAIRLPQILASIYVPVEAARRIELCMQATTNIFAKSLHLSSIMPDPLEAAPGENDLMQWLATFSDASALADAAKSAGRWFSHVPKPGEISPEWQCQTNRRLMVSIMDAIPDESFQVGLEAFMSSGAKACASKLDFVVLCDMYVPLSQVAITLAYLSQFIEDGGDSCTRSYKLKQEIDRAGSFIKSTIALALDKCKGGAGERGDTSKFASWPLAFPVSLIPSWLRRAQSVCQSLMKELMVRTGVSLSSLAAEVVSVTPQWESLISDTQFHEALAKKGVLQFKGRQALSEKTVLLNGSICDMARVHTSWALTPKIDHDPLFSTTLSDATTVFNKAKKAIEIIAIMRTLYEMSGDERASNAAQLITKMGDSMPKTLKAALHKAYEGK